MPHVELPQAEFKVVMLGDTNVGKTSLVLRFAEGFYRENSRSPTVGAFFITKRVQTSNGITCKVQIWDTAGQKQYRQMAPMYYKTAAAAVICYDVTNPDSFEVLKEWLDELQPMVAAGNLVVAIAATKSDLIDDPSTKTIVPPHQAKELAQQVGQNGAIFVDTSARNDENVNLLFQKVAEEVLYVREQAVALRNGNFAGNNGFGSAGGKAMDLNSSGYGLEDALDDGDIIPVIPGASIDERGQVVKSYPRSSKGGAGMNGNGGPGSGGGIGMNGVGTNVGGTGNGSSHMNDRGGMGNGNATSANTDALAKRNELAKKMKLRGRGTSPMSDYEADVGPPLGPCMSIMECSSRPGDAYSCTIC